MRATVDPDIYDVASVPKGKKCQMWTGEKPSRCGGDAEVVFVYEGTLEDGVEKPKNALACSECAPERLKADDRS
jgi:hypothetical protein